ncbi:MAG TPA: hypothetical protein DDX33_04935 [Rikenellaceae bacterium]|nr:hypothetical protein [Rikenellaceae bacterium]
MLKRSHITILLLFFLVTARTTSAREKRVGLFNSPKGFGLSMQLDSKAGDEISSFNLYGDTYGLLSGRTSDIGLAFSYSHNYILRVFDFKYCRSSLYAGAGVLCSYVHDHEEGIFSNPEESQLAKEMGFVLALNCNAGYGIDFDRGISVDLSFSLSPGVFIHKKDDSSEILASLYKRGIFEVLMPQLCVFYRF